jgi:hypothetical protein
MIVKWHFEKRKWWGPVVVVMDAEWHLVRGWWGIRGYELDKKEHAVCR